MEEVRGLRHTACGGRRSGSRREAERALSPRRRALLAKGGNESVADIAQFFDKDYEQKEFKELAEAPVDAIQGLSEGDAEKLQEAFNVKSVRDLAENKFVRIAQAVVALSGSR